ncbi:hypothetical protein XELAEV_18027052mg [Xenopus laevis]|uniref:Myb/SANT-like DNA-binding domain-containing protein n=1 Tax=Xenopus laevis TaxID=8355 RepID=A0A974HJK9_XENLA|nr:hypothetical protein XELAEV_18027052mg [Xenopus laevis]
MAKEAPRSSSLCQTSPSPAAWLRLDPGEGPSSAPSPVPLESFPEKVHRAVSFSENTALVHHAVRHRAFGKDCQRTSMARKTALWSEIVCAVNAVGCQNRNRKNCQKRLADIKRQMKKIISEHKRYMRGTGGGPPSELELREYEEEISKMLGPDTISGMEGSFYTDATGPDKTQDSNQQQSETCVEDADSQQTLPIDDNDEDLQSGTH